MQLCRKEATCIQHKLDNIYIIVTPPVNIVVLWCFRSLQNNFGTLTLLCWYHNIRMSLGPTTLTSLAKDNM